jgi:hypothetical protein
MELSINIQYTLKNILPSLELCNEKILHNKVQDDDIGIFKGNYDLCRIIPKGKKYLMWLKLHRNIPTTYLFELHSKTKVILNVFLYKFNFSKYLTNNKGTIFYGSIININDNIKQNTFIIEDILYFKGKNTQNINWINKLDIFLDLYDNYLSNQNINDKVTHNKENIVCLLPYTSKTLNKDKIKKLDELYNIYSIQYLVSNRCYTELYTKTFTYKITLLAKPKIQNDIYELYYYNNINNCIEYLDIALIPDYKTSVFMNNYYRNIKENINLDYLEESDDEVEFENINIDKYVDLNKEYIFECLYNSKFKKWVPIKKVNIVKEEISDIKTIKNIEKKCLTNNTKKYNRVNRNNSKNKNNYNKNNYNKNNYNKNNYNKNNYNKNNYNKNAYQYNNKKQNIKYEIM